MDDDAERPEHESNQHESTDQESAGHEPAREQSAAAIRRRLQPGRWRREDGQEFDRVAFFSDAVFAIALTLLALDLRVEQVPSPQDAPASMFEALGDLFPKLVAYAVGFILLARYWMAHHGFFGRLSSISSRLIGLNLVYLGFVALLPFPTSVVGRFEANPVSVMIFAINLAAISGMETVMLWQAQRSGLIRHPERPAVQRWELMCSAAPAVMFIATIPIAFLLSPTAQLLSWIPVGGLVGFLLGNNPPEDRAQSA